MAKVMMSASFENEWRVPVVNRVSGEARKRVPLPKGLKKFLRKPADRLFALCATNPFVSPMERDVFVAKLHRRRAKYEQADAWVEAGGDDA